MTRQPVERPEPGSEYTVITLHGDGLRSGLATRTTISEHGVETSTDYVHVDDLLQPDTEEDNNQ
jgi:hypothetical protein